MVLEIGQLFCIEKGSYRWSSQFYNLRGFLIQGSPPFTFLGVEFRILIVQTSNIRNLCLSYDNISRLEPLHVRFRINLNYHFNEHETKILDRRSDFTLFLSDISLPFGIQNNLTIVCELKRLSEVENPLVLEEKLPTKKLVEEEKDSNTHVDEEKMVSENKIFKKLQKDFNDMFLSGEDCDCTLKVQNKEFIAHRIILRARSPVFKCMFSHDMEENRSGVVDIEDCDPKTFPDFLKYLYSGSTEHISEENVCHLYTASDKYQVEELKQECAQFMKSHLSIETFCDFLTLALKHSEEELIDIATKFFCGNTVKIAETPKWQIFLQENSTVGNELFLKALSRETKT